MVVGGGAHPRWRRGRRDGSIPECGGRMSNGVLRVIAAAAVIAVAGALAGLAAWPLWRVPDIDTAGGVRVVLEVDRDAPRRPTSAVPADLVRASIAVLKHRLRELGIANANVTADGDDRIVIAFAGATAGPVDEVVRTVSAAVRLEFRMVDPESPDEAWRARIRKLDDLLSEPAPARQQLLVRKEVVVDGGDIVDARAGVNQFTGSPTVNFKFNDAGTERFARATRENVDGRLAIVLNGEVISAPFIREPIAGGSGEITGSFTIESANALAIQLRSGVLPVSYTVVETRVIQPRAAGH